jgi:levansucrase
MTPFRWLPEHVAAIGERDNCEAPVFKRSMVPDILPGHDVWDHWPVLREDGTVAEVAAGCLIIALTAAKGCDPEDRHQISRMRLFHLVGDRWRDLGHLLPAAFSPGTREWAGSATLSPQGDRLKLFFTATGDRGDVAGGFTQRLFETEAKVRIEGSGIVITDWRSPRESVAADGILYETDMVGGGEVGTIKAFRDPFFFRDPSGAEYLLFTASDPMVSSAWNGVIGAAVRSADGWQLLPPLVRADDLNNELERPHIVEHGGMVYLFWSTQRKVFKRGGPTGPTGLYGVVAEKWGSPWRPLNGTGLVFGNPRYAPFQAYSFQVLADLSVRSFADMPEIHVIPAGVTERRAAFLGGPAPLLQLQLDDDKAKLIDVPRLGDHHNGAEQLF